MNLASTRPFVTAPTDPGPRPRLAPAASPAGAGTAPGPYVETSVPPGVTLHAYRYRNTSARRTRIRIFNLTTHHLPRRKHVQDRNA